MLDARRHEAHSLCFVAAAIRLKPEWTHVLAAAAPSRPHGEAATYWFIGASILGASLSPTLFLIYSSGAIEDRWTAAMSRRTA
ncbi:divalent metal cation transporter [Paraburkholderia sp.]|uniref:divalent metal cation transporter n=1 Tax=Paraburkholderia sp. TaxID=1926495 RepID=UPI002F3FFC22